MTPIAIAPMMDWTDRHYRYLIRLLSKYVTLFTEMIPTGALQHGNRRYLLDYAVVEHPVIAQLGGSDPKALAHCAGMIAHWGYDGVNLNVGCPSDRVQAAEFGACLMAKPQQVADCFKAMQDQVTLPVTIKTRIGIDNRDSYHALAAFIDTLHQAGCHSFVIHARKAWLHGLSPKENRTIPPLRYAWVYQLKRDFPNLTLLLNGGLTIDTALHHVKQLDGVMIGRHAYQSIYACALIDKLYYQDPHPIVSRDEVLDRYLNYMAKELKHGIRLPVMAKHLLTLFQGETGAKGWRRALSEQIHNPDASVKVIEQAWSRFGNSR